LAAIGKQEFGLNQKTRTVRANVLHVRIGRVSMNGEWGGKGERAGVGEPPESDGCHWGFCGGRGRQIVFLLRRQKKERVGKGKKVNTAISLPEWERPRNLERGLKGSGVCAAVRPTEASGRRDNSAVDPVSTSRAKEDLDYAELKVGGRRQLGVRGLDRNCWGLEGNVRQPYNRSIGKGTKGGRLFYHLPGFPLPRSL